MSETKQQSPQSKRADLQHRLQWFHRNVALGNHPTPRQLSEQFAVSLRQAFYDIRYLRGQLAAPLVFSRSAGGYVYENPFVLPATFTEEQEEECSGLASLLNREDESLAASAAVQLQIPFQAVIVIEDPVSVLNFRCYLKEELGGGRFVCEFPNPDLFLSLVFTDRGGIRIEEPVWLRERLCRLAEKVLQTNRPQEDPHAL